MTRRLGLGVVGVVMVGSLSAWLAWEGLLGLVHSPFSGHSGEAFVTIRPGMTATAAARQLVGTGVIERERLFLFWLWWTDSAGGIQAGEYRFDTARSIAQVSETLTSGHVVLRPVTIPEGSTRWQVAAAIESFGFGDAEEALRLTGDPTPVADLDSEAQTLEGYLYPDTYMAPASDGPAELIAAMVARARAEWTPERRARAAELGMSVREVVILASIIEAETPSAEERAVISAVFHNRLERGMLLQTDPTVLYAKRMTGKQERMIRRSDLERDSPYNTYLYSGLPAGPIGNPRAASIDAALWPEDVDLLYFVSRNDGTHAFSRSLSEHNRMVNRYQRSP